MKRTKPIGTPMNKWHLWYAWHPIRTYRDGDGTTSLVWLEQVERRMMPSFHGVRWDYRLAPSRPIQHCSGEGCTDPACKHFA